ncbi:MAG: hypothetical protein GXP24_05810 [Planctomycetes bacterium]|nr:hypothetical protein [Planctomycetota bacterium]
MIQRDWLLALLICFALSNTVSAAEKVAAPVLLAVAEPTSLDASNASAENQQWKETKADESPHRDPLAFTLWEFQIEIKAFQHEPANKNLDEFNATLNFFAILPQASSSVQSWSGYGTMTSTVISRASHSFQAPNRALNQYGVQADSFWDHQGKQVQVIVMPKDAVTYSLTTGQVLGTTSILQYILPFASTAGLEGSLQAFAIPESTAAGTVFQCSFDTSGHDVCWYEGRATLKVLNKRVGVYPPQKNVKGSTVSVTASGADEDVLPGSGKDLLEGESLSEPTNTVE